MKKPLYRVVLLTALGLLASGCSTVTDWIAPAEIDPPTELSDVAEQVSVQTVWSRDVGGSGDQRLALVPRYHEGRLYTADADGKVNALDAASGKVIWSVSLDLPLSGGPGVGEGLVLLGTTDAEVVALSLSNGQEVWRARVSSEVLSTPVAALGHAVVRTIDGKVFGLDARDGSEQWRFEREIPTLTLRGTSTPVISGSSVLCGMAGGRLLALDIRSGNVIWDAAVSVPSGRSELERLSDIDGAPLLMDGVVYVATYQGDVAAMGERNGSLLWRRKFSTYAGMAADRYQVYASDADGLMWALDADNGTAGWRQEGLRNRQLSDVAVISGVVAVGDFEGYVHFLSPEDGSLIGRTRVGSEPIMRGMLVAQDLLFVQGEGGELEALRVAPGR